MTYAIVFGPEARDQFANIEDHIAEAGSPIAAARYVDAIVAYCVGLADFPLRGRRRDDLMQGLRITNYQAASSLPSSLMRSHASCRSLASSTAAKIMKAGFQAFWMTN